MQSARIELDRFDHAILRVLAAEGRISATLGPQEITEAHIARNAIPA